MFVQSLGCRASQADGAAIEASLEARGYLAVAAAAAADLVVLNTCTVTQAADVDARRILRGWHREHPGAEILVTGCYAQRAPQELAEIEGVRWVVGNSHKTEIATLVSDPREDYHGQVLAGDMSLQKDFLASPINDVSEGRTRPNLKVQDGCGNRCSFCAPNWKPPLPTCCRSIATPWASTSHASGSTPGCCCNWLRPPTVREPAT